MDLNDFFLRKTENGINSRFCESNYSFIRKEVEDYVLSIIATPYQAFLDFVAKDPISPFVLSSDVPQFSSIDSATIKICEVLSTKELKGYKFEEIGEMLQPERIGDIVANKKYGENHVKAASDLGLCFNHDGRYYISPVGVIFTSLSNYQQDQLLARFALRNNFVYTVMHKALCGNEVSVVEEISFLSESTVKRRKNNCIIMCRLTQRNRDVNVDAILTKIK